MLLNGGEWKCSECRRTSYMQFDDSGGRTKESFENETHNCVKCGGVLSKAVPPKRYPHNKKCELLPEAIEIIKEFQYKTNQGMFICIDCGSFSHTDCSPACTINNLIAKYEAKP